MERFEELGCIELQEEVNGGGFLSAVAGGLAGALVGAYVGLVPTAITGDASYVGKATVTGTTLGVWIGAGCPLP